MTKEEFFTKQSYQIKQYDNLPSEILNHGTHTFNYVDIETTICDDRQPPLQSITIDYNQIGIENINIIYEQVQDKDNSMSIYSFKYINNTYLLILQKEHGNYSMDSALRGKSLAIIQQSLIEYDGESEFTHCLTPFVEKEALEAQINTQLNNCSNQKIKL